MIVIYAGDIERGQVSAESDIGAVRMSIETVFLSELNSNGEILFEIIGKSDLTDRFSVFFTKTCHFVNARNLCKTKIRL